MDRIELRDVRVDCIVGTRTDERVKAQEIKVTTSIGLDAGKAAASCNLLDTVDYAAFYAVVQFIIGRAHFLLLETAAEALARYLLLSSPELVREVTISIAKPHIMPPPCVPCVSLTRSANRFFTISRRTRFGAVAVVQESSDAGIYLLTIAAQRRVAVAALAGSSEHTMTLTKGLKLQHKSLPAFYAITWPPSTPRCWDNTTAQPQQFLCINRPACDPTVAKTHSLSAAQLPEVTGTVLYPS